MTKADSTNFRQFLISNDRRYHIATLTLFLWIETILFALCKDLSMWRTALLMLSSIFCAIAMAKTVAKIVLSLTTSSAELALPPPLGSCPIDEPIWFTVPVIVRTNDDIDDACECVYDNVLLAQSPLVRFVILFDFADADREVIDADAEVLSLADLRIAELNKRLSSLGYRQALHLFRSRRYDEVDNKWLGWERKRGKLIEFMRLQQGDATTSFGIPTDLITPCRFLITVDVDSRFENLGVQKLWHGYKHGVLDNPSLTILCPALDTPKLCKESLFRRLLEPFFLEGGWVGPEPTARQLLLGYDHFYGKGLIVIDAFLESTRRAIPENAVLSHDHLEGLLNVTASYFGSRLLEPFPSSRAAWEARQHRWIRGDFQLLPWAVRGGRTDDSSNLQLKSRMRIVGVFVNDLVPLSQWLLLLASVVFFADGDHAKLSSFIALIIFPTVSTLPISLVRYHHLRFRPPGSGLVERSELVLRGLSMGVARLIYAQRDALLAIDAVSLTMLRLVRGRAKMLEWHPSGPLSIASRITIFEIALTFLAGFEALHSQANWLAISAWFLIAPRVCNLGHIRVRHVVDSPLGQDSVSKIDQSLLHINSGRTLSKMQP